MYFKHDLEKDGDWGQWDLFFSTYNLSNRLTEVFNKVCATKKIWLIAPEYNFSDNELGSIEDEIHILNGSNEANQILNFLKEVNIEKFKGKRILVDATGFMRPHLLFLLAYFKTLGFPKVDFIYTEPDRYSKKENTVFSSGSILHTRQVTGYRGQSRVSSAKDLLIIASGYDSNLIKKIAQQNENAEIVPLLGFPSLRADMYQENVIRTIDANESLPEDALSSPIFAPASDPFETASTIKMYLDNNNCLNKYKHIYLCPLSTKAQTLGIGLLYQQESYMKKPVSIIFPFAESYDKETSVGISKICIYEFEFDLVP